MTKNNTSKSLLFYHKNNPETESLFPEGGVSYGMTAFLVRSLEKVKQNTPSEALKNLIDIYIGEYLLHIKDFNVMHEVVQIPVTDPSFALYAKTAYHKVMKEEECLNRLLDSLERNNF